MTKEELKARFSVTAKEIKETLDEVKAGNMSVVAAITSVVAVVITILIGAILAGSFSSVANSANLGLDANWTGAVDAIGQISITAFQIAGFLPIAIVATVVIGVIGWVGLRN